MHLSQKEKNIISKICASEIKCFRDYIISFCGLKNIENDGQIFFENGGVLSIDRDILLVKNESELLLKQHLFIALCNRMQSLGFLDKVYSSILSKPSLLTYSETKGYNSAIACEDIYLKYGDFHIIPTHDLFKFLTNDFMTDDEIEQQERREELKSEQNARKRSELITISISVLSMLISILLAYFNYKTYTNERKVYIENMSNLQSPIKVEIINRDDFEQQNSQSLTKN